VATILLTKQCPKYLYQQHASLRLGGGTLSGKSICWFTNQAVTIFEYF